MRHPASAILSAFLDGELAAYRRKGVAKHLAVCAECRRALTDWRSLGESIRSGPMPLPAAEDLWDLIDARRAVGERRILAIADSAPAGGWRRAFSIIAATIALLLGGSLTFRESTNLMAESSDLTLYPARPVSGEIVTVEYRAGSLLGQNDRLVLRGRFRTAQDEAYNGSMKSVRVADLERDAGGVYKGSFKLPDSVVYAIFAVEDAEAVDVDTNLRRGWDLLVHGPDGRPLYEALEQQMNDLHGRNWETAHSVAQSAVRLYPDRVESWSTLLFFDQQVLGESGMDSVRTAHLARLAKFDATLTRQQEVSGDDAGGMYWYALGLRDTVASARWKARLVAEHPEHPLAVQERTVEAWRAHSEDPSRLVQALDTLWDEVGPAHGQLVTQGIRAASRSGDPAAIQRWADRGGQFKRMSPFYLATLLLEDPALREEGIRRLRSHIRLLEEMKPENRGVFSTVEEYRRTAFRSKRQAQAVIGRVLIESGRKDEGVKELTAAVATGWDPSLFRDAAKALLAAGDTASAVSLWAKVAVDPTTAPAFEDTALASAGTKFGAGWSELVRSSRAEMQAEVLADAVWRPVHNDIRLTDQTGGAIRFSALTENRASLIVFWSRFCGPALEAIPEIQRLSVDLARDSVQVLLITDEPPSMDLQRFLKDQGVSIPMYHDTRRDASRAFQQWGTPSYFIMDGNGSIAFEYTELGAVRRQLAVLQE